MLGLSRKEATSRRFVFCLPVFVVFVVLLSNQAAAQSTSSSIDWGTLIMGLFGGLALFLFGMEQLGDGLKAAAGTRLKEFLAKLTRTRITAAIAGAGVTAVIQSSSVTTVLVVGFVSAGVMTFSQSIGVIMGANVGTTVTAQIVAFKVQDYALAMIAVGFAVVFATKRNDLRHYGSVILGLGLVFFGMGIMSGAMSPLRTYPPFMDLMVSLHDPLPAITIAAIFTALIQSSSATTGIVVVMAGSGLISLQTGIAMALGANIGTCATAALAAIGKPTDAQRAAVIHILFNVVGVLIWVSLIDVLADMSRLVSPTYPQLSSMERLAAETPRQIANANTLFNVLNTVLLIGFSGVLAKIAIRLVPERARVTHHFVKPRFLDDDLIATPSLALECARFEFGHLGGYLIDMMQSVKVAILRRDRHSLDAMRTLDDRVDMLFTDIMEYLAKIRRKQLSAEESQSLEELFIASNNVEAAGDIISERLTEIGEDWIASGRQPSETTRHILESLHKTVSTAVVNAICAVRDNDKNAAEAVILVKPEVLRLVADAYAFQSNRITVANPQHLETLRTEMELVESLRQIYSLTRRMARTVPPEQFAAIATNSQ